MDKRIESLIEKQRKYFLSGATLPVVNRISALKKLKRVILQNETRINDALYRDLGKSPSEAYMCEVGQSLAEIKYMIKHLPALARDKRVITPVAQFAAKSYVKSSPYGVVLVMSPWNYPFLLSIDPLVDAIAAGNTVIIKPSAYSNHTGQLVADIIGEAFDPALVAVVTGGRNENQQLLEQKFDYIFFTGSETVGKYVMKKASEHLTPVTLELGGKSPCIVDKSANIPLAAKRIVFGKFMNCGQTCVAPDYVLCHSAVKDDFISELKRQIAVQLGEKPIESPDYGRIINRKHFDRIIGLIDREKVVYGGGSCAEKLKIEPTVMDRVSYEDAVMDDEIFGPLLPVITFNSIGDVAERINLGKRPLALYLFSSDKGVIRRITEKCAFGGGCINDTLIHLASTNLGFGGVGESGMGAYHGKVGFETFSHKKSIVDKKTFIDLPMRYQPYSSVKDKLIRMFLK